MKNRHWWRSLPNVQCDSICHFGDQPLHHLIGEQRPKRGIKSNVTFTCPSQPIEKQSLFS
jgi:hypothetical protein